MTLPSAFLYVVSKDLLLDFNSLLRLPFGEATQNTIFTLSLENRPIYYVFPNALVANLPQLFISLFYFSINALVTSLFLAREWDTYGLHRKGLRVSDVPVCAQRGTYKLQLPYRYSLPLMAVSSLLHWLVSQSAFLVALETYSWSPPAQTTPDNPPNPTNWHTSQESLKMSCGYSPPAIACAVVTVAVLMLFCIGIGARKFKSCIPVVGSCSAAMAAACHPGNLHDTGTAWSEVRWGVTKTGIDGVGHCAISANEVEEPKVGVQYM
jgi:hypothetical protein